MTERRCSGCGHLPRPDDITLEFGPKDGPTRLVVARHKGCKAKWITTPRP